MNSTSFKKFIAPLVPYITVGIGLLVCHNAWLAMLSYHAAMALILLFSKSHINIRQGYQSKTFWIPVLLALIGVGAGILLYLLWPYLDVPGDFRQYLRSVGLYGWTWPVFIVYASLVNPLLEESYWRGYLGSSAKNITVNDLLFAGYHLLVIGGNVRVIWLIAVFCGLAIAAWFWRQINRMNGGLLVSLISHLTADTAVFLAIYYFAVR
jgi:membrane protease YdiL (CAAX protease family)